jgi:hypothetical protein
MKVLSLNASSKLKQRVYCFQSIFHDCSQLFPASFPRIHNLAQWDCLASQVSRYSATEEPLAVEDADFTHVPRIESDRDVLTDVSRERERQLAEGMEVNAIWADSSCPEFVNQQQIQPLQIVGHAW